MVGDVAGVEAFHFLSFTDLDDYPLKIIPDVSIHRGVEGLYYLKSLFHIRRLLTRRKEPIHVEMPESVFRILHI